MGAAMVLVGYFNWRYDWNYRYAKWLIANLPPRRKLSDRVADARLMRGFYRGFSSGVLLLAGGVLLILGARVIFVP